MFENLKKRFSKKKSAYKKASRSGVGIDATNVVEKEFRKYDFLSWLNPFLRLKNTKSNLSTISDEEDESFEYSSVEKEVDIDEDRPFGNGSDSDSASVLSASSIKRRKELSTPCISKSSKISATTGNASWVKGSLQEAEIDVMKSISKAFKNDSSSQHTSEFLTRPQDQDEIFGMMVAGELKSFDAKHKFRIKHEISNIIYKYHEMESQKPANMFTFTSPLPTPSRNNETKTTTPVAQNWYSNFDSYMHN